MCFTLGVEIKSEVVVFIHDLFDIGVLVNATLRVESNHIRCGNRLAQFEAFFQPFFIGILHVLLIGHGDDEVDVFVRIVVLVILDVRRYLLSLDDFFQLVLKVLCPSSNW